MPLKILINGAGVAGPTLAAMLLSSSPSYSITVVERAPDLRTGGQQIDLRAQGIPIMKRMGLLDTIKAHCVDEAGMAFVDAHGRVQATLGRNDSGQGPQGLTSEFEIVRGDLVRVLHRASLDAAARRAGAGRPADDVLRYEFGKHATGLVQRADGVDVAFSDGSSGTFDLVVGADGQGSRTRRLLLGRAAADAAFRSVGVHIAFFSIPPDPAGEGDPPAAVARICHAPGRRLLSTRSGDPRATQVFLATMRPGAALEAAEAAGGDVGAQKAALAELFRGAGWRADELLDRMRATEDFYCHHAGQVRLDRWHEGRVALLGDAGYCPSPITGMGTTAAFVGCYVLAGELARHARGGDLDVDAALEGYERVLRPFVKEAQQLPWGMPRLFYYETRWGIWFAHKVLAIFTALRIDKLLYKILPEDNGDWQIPDYPELNFQVES